MKLIYLANIRMPTPWAHGIQIMKMCEAFAKVGFTVELIVPRRFNKLKQDPWQYYSLSPNFKVTKLPCLDLMPVRVNRLTFLLEELSFFLSAKLFLFWRRYDILYTREVLAGLLFRRHVLELHIIPDVIKPIHRWLWSRVRRLIVLTKIMQVELEGQKIKAPTMVAPDGVDLEQFSLTIGREHARQELNLPQNKKIVMYAGSLYLYDWKGVDVLLQAAVLLPPDTIVVLVGGSQAEIEQLKQKIKVDSIIFTGRQPHHIIPLYLQAADILVLPNTASAAHSAKYTSPLKLFEYMASCRPIVASDLPALREVLNDDSTKLVPPGDAQALADGIKQILQEPELAGRLARQARQDVKQYSWRRRAMVIKEFITDSVK